jgi:NAD(P)H dehydrogenase (quinone)
MAAIAADAARAAGAEVRLLKVRETAPHEAIHGQDGLKAEVERSASVPWATPDDMELAEPSPLSFPTRFGSAQNLHGGQESTMLGLYAIAMHWRAETVAPGFIDPVLFKADGKPYGYSHTKGAERDDNARAAITHQARRLVEVPAKLRG